MQTITNKFTQMQVIRMKTLENNSKLKENHVKANPPRTMLNKPSIRMSINPERLSKYSSEIIYKASFRKCKQLQANPSKYKQVLANTSKCKHI